VSVWQLGEPNVSPAPYIVKEDLNVWPVEARAVLEVAGEVLVVLVAGTAAATVVGTVEALTTGGAALEVAGSLATGAAADEEAGVLATGAAAEDEEPGRHWE